MARIYVKGIKMPWQEVDWKTMCEPSTLVTDEDPHIDIPNNLVPLDAADQILKLLNVSSAQSLIL